MNFSFGLQWHQSFKVFKWTAGCNLKCEKTKIKLARNIKKGIFKQIPSCMM